MKSNDDTKTGGALPDAATDKVMAELKGIRLALASALMRVETLIEAVERSE